MDSFVKEFSEDSLDELLQSLEAGLSEEEEKGITEEKIKTLCETFVEKAFGEEYLGFKLSNFMILLVVLMPINEKSVSSSVASSLNFVEAVLKILEEGNDEDWFNTACAFLPIFKLGRRKVIHISNRKSLRIFNKLLLDQITDYNDNDEMKRLFSNCVINHTAVLGEKELKNVIQHENQLDFYRYLISTFVDQDPNMLDKICFFSMLISDYELCSKCLYPLDFATILKVVIDELRRNCGSEKDGLFENYGSFMMKILESKMYIVDYEKVLVEEIHTTLKEIIEDELSTEDSVDTCKLILEIVDFVMND